MFAATATQATRAAQASAQAATQAATQAAASAQPDSLLSNITAAMVAYNKATTGSESAAAAAAFGSLMKQLIDSIKQGLDTLNTHAASDLVARAAVTAQATMSTAIAGSTRPGNHPFYDAVGQFICLETETEGNAPTRATLLIEGAVVGAAGGKINVIQRVRLVGATNRFIVGDIYRLCLLLDAIQSADHAVGAYGMWHPEVHAAAEVLAAALAATCHQPDERVLA